MKQITVIKSTDNRLKETIKHVCSFVTLIWCTQMGNLVAEKISRL